MPEDTPTTETALIWAGYEQAPAQLAVACMPQQPIVEHLLGLVSELLRRNGHAPELLSYAHADSARLSAQAAALWNVLLGLRLSALPAQANNHAQPWQTPEQLIETRRASPLECALLCAALFERMGLHPLLLVEKETVFSGVWMQAERFPSVCNDDVVQLRKRVQLREIVVFDSALLTQGQSFREAIRLAQQRLLRDESFVLALDIASARQRRLLPYGMEAARVADLDVLDVPDLAPAPAQPETATAPSAPLGRLEQWQRRLLDLSLRNALLNLRDSRFVVPLLVPDAVRLEARLLQGEAFVIEALPATRQQEEGLSTLAREESAQIAIEKNRLLAPRDAEKLEASLVDLYRKARSDLEESGASTLFLAIGFLRWQRPGAADRSYRAPLILLPVNLLRKSVNAGVRLVLGDDEPRFNTTLLEMLRQDFALDIQGLDSLPVGELGIGIPALLDRMRREVLDLEGFEITTDVALTTFSFAKYLMWKDLADRLAQVRDNPVVRHLVESPRESFQQAGRFIAPEELDKRLDPSELFTPLPADSSQLAAIVAAAEGRSFVMIGPPGTGKSQTIANMIAHNMALGRRVLFVAEKTAALEVVYRRLRQQGLGDFCLELHSCRARRAEVFQQLGSAWQARNDVQQVDWAHETQRLRVLRDELNAVVDALHQRRRNGWSVRSALAVVVSHTAVPRLDLQLQHPDQHEAADLERLWALGERLGFLAASVGDLRQHPLAFIAQEKWGIIWQEQLLAAAASVLPLAHRQQETLLRLRHYWGLTQPLEGAAALATQWQLAQWLMQHAGQNFSFIFQEDIQERLATIERASALLTRLQGIERRFHVAWPREKIARLDLKTLEPLWRDYSESWWPLQKVRERQLRAWLDEQVPHLNSIEVGPDLMALRKWQGVYKELSGLAAGLRGVPEWRGLESDPASVQAVVESAQAVLSLLAQLAPDAASAQHVQRHVQVLLNPSQQALLADISRLARDYQQTETALQPALATFAELAGCAVRELYTPGETGLAQLIARLSTLEQHAARLNNWCGWRRVRREAQALGLQPFVLALEAGTVLPSQARQVLEVNYLRGWLALQVDAEPVLRDFVSTEHERKIARFRELDERIRSVTADCIRARINQQLSINDVRDTRTSHELGFLRRELEKKSRHKPLRQVLAEAPNAVAALTPCLLMSPLSVAQYLPANQAPFDVVIFDEASQIAVWDAIGAMARARQVVMVGDPKQLPPTTFFTNTPNEEEIAEDEDLESILDELIGANLPTLTLSWHYRSRHESLITFSNHRYYKGSLITFPSPNTEDRAVDLSFVGGVYERGTSQTNRAEADAVIADIERRLEGLEPGVLTLGVVTFNQKQQTLIQDLLDEARRRNPLLDRHFEESLDEPVFVKNLESVQGDERDVILFSTTFGPDSTGQVSLNFGPLNRIGGERRLNVAITRARSALRVFTSLRPEQIDIARTEAAGVRDLRHFLEFAERGAVALDAAVFGSQGGFDSPFEEEVARALEARGWTLHSQVGVSKFRVDLGVVDPDLPGRYLAGVECDGATYHRSATARDRDKIREAVLRDLGWDIVRLWSTDFWLDPVGSIERLDAALHQLLTQRRQKAALTTDAIQSA